MRLANNAFIHGLRFRNHFIVPGLICSITVSQILIHRRDLIQERRELFKCFHGWSNYLVISRFTPVTKGTSIPSCGASLGRPLTLSARDSRKATSSSHAVELRKRVRSSGDLIFFSGCSYALIAMTTMKCCRIMR